MSKCLYNIYEVFWKLEVLELCILTGIWTITNLEKIKKFEQSIKIKANTNKFVSRKNQSRTAELS